MVEVNNISIYKSNRLILNEVSIKAMPGEVTAIIGPNGAGKSTLLKSIAGEEILQDGTVRINDTPLSQWRPEQLAKIRGVLSQSTHIPYAMKVIDVVALGRYPYSKQETYTESIGIAKHMLQQVGMAKFENRNIAYLSGGEQQRVHLARVLAQITSPKGKQTNQVPRFLLLDEPTSSQDIAQQHQLLSLISSLCKKQNIGVIAILHDMNQAALYTDKIFLIKAGRIIAAGTPPEVLTSQHIQAGFGINAMVMDHPYSNTIQVFTYPQTNKYLVQ